MHDTIRITVRAHGRKFGIDIPIDGYDDKITSDPDTTAVSATESYTKPESAQRALLRRIENTLQSHGYGYTNHTIDDIAKIVADARAAAYAAGKRELITISDAKRLRLARLFLDFYRRAQTKRNISTGEYADRGIAILAEPD